MYSYFRARYIEPYKQSDILPSFSKNRSYAPITAEWSAPGCIATFKQTAGERLSGSLLGHVSLTTLDAVKLV